MKTKFYIFFFAWGFFVPQILEAQSFFIGGANYSVQVPSINHNFIKTFPFGNQKNENFVLKPMGGYGYHFDLKGKWSYQPSISFGDIGGNNDLQIWPKQIFEVYAIVLDQFIDYKPISWFSVGFSPTIYSPVWATWVNSQNEVKSWTTTNKKNLIVFSIVPRISFHLNEHWSINLSYRNDLTPFGLSPLNINPTTDYIETRGYGLGLNIKYKMLKD